MVSSRKAEGQDWTVNQQLNPGEGETKGDILIVDDTVANLRLLADMLAEHGYHARPVPSGGLAVAAARAQPPDLILLDIRMPGMDGYEVSRILKEDPTTRDVPIIFLSALDATADKVRAFQAGGVDYVTKPFQIEEVIARVQAHVALRRLQQELQIANAKMQRELALAAEVQASFLPRALPDIPGWQLAVKLVPARQTSGDFYDVSLLPDGRVSLLIGDVVDKGVPAALFMALSWTLARTYIAEYPGRPELVLESVNRRILQDTGADQFVTAFCGFLDPTTGDLAYGNAGHPPPCVFRGHGRQRVEKLPRTGMPLGVLEDGSWPRQRVHLAAGDVLVLYTDGITEAQDRRSADFGQDRLLASVRANLGRPAAATLDAILADVERFADRAPQSDDIALVVVIRDGA
jgi:sigma-B regulation protein RsbU (phosphoserine phosphatase)